METKKLAKLLGCDSDNSTYIKETLKRKGIKELNDAVEVMGAANKTANIAKFGPRLDYDFLCHDYHELLKETKPIPTLIGYSAHESIFFCKHLIFCTVHNNSYSSSLCLCFSYPRLPQIL